ncbi:hypothetical protein AXF42_Ash010067 [Apostasia shenzhenica]|uniref:RNase H type-1 domain-containing protein n=1 Tax=Apostasia shenzhenica TaxID=1088818 RepID=A0A2I0ACQ6_9ASPA|nr:hypothetical protein AXF42_Ash010067 [Apostasia shenzhenica]
MGAGLIIRNHNGVALLASSKRIKSRFFLHLAESIAIKEGIQFLLSHGFDNWALEYAISNAVNVIYNRAPFASEDPITETIREGIAQVKKGSIHFCPQLKNRTTHYLASLAFSLHTNEKI